MTSRIAVVYRRAAVILLNTILLVLLLEMAAGAVLKVLPAPATWPATESPYVKEHPAALGPWRELEGLLSRFRYHPYSLWRMAPFEGRFINVTADGLRVVPGASCAPSAHHVWIFGGSALWGAGSADDQTIPAQLQRVLQRSLDRPVCVVNFGQLGYTSSQGVLTLEGELRQHRRPHLAVFYDGVNDTVSAFAYLRAGLHFAYPEIRRRIEAQRLDAQPRAADLLLWSSQYRLLTRLIVKPARAPAVTPRPDALAEDVVATYLENVRIVTSLGREYDFRSAFFWQPSLAAEPAAAGALANLDASPEQLRFARRVRLELRRRATGVHDLTDLLSTRAQHAYFDWHHTTPEANLVIAETIGRAVSRSPDRVD